MISLARVYDQKNLQEITKRQYRNIEDRINKNYFLSITRNSTMNGDRTGRFIFVNDVKNPFSVESRVYLLIQHYIPNVEIGSGLKIVYKVDADLFKMFSEKFPEEA